MTYKSKIPLLILLGLTFWGLTFWGFWRTARKRPDFGGFVEEEEWEMYE